MSAGQVIKRHIKKAGCKIEESKKGQSRSHESKLELTGTNCCIHLSPTAGTAKLQCPKEEVGTLAVELHLCSGFRESEAGEAAGTGEAVGQLMSNMYITCPDPDALHPQWLRLHFCSLKLMEISLWPTLTQNHSEKCNSSLTKLTEYTL